MIKIDRTDCPKVLIGSPLTGKHYKKKTVVSALWEMQNHKCCYCEHEIPETGHLKTVDHFRPQSIFTSLINNWDNLLLSCSQCNGKKSNKFPVLADNKNERKVIYIEEETIQTSVLINPSDQTIDPEYHITYIIDDREEEFGLIISKGNSLSGKITIEVIGLSGLFYTKKNQKYLREVLLENYKNLLIAKDSDNNEQIEIIKERFILYMSSKHELAALSRAFVNYKRLDQRFSIRVLTGTEIN